MKNNIFGVFNRTGGLPFLIGMTILIAANSCKKTDSPGGSEDTEVFTKLFPSAGDGSYWKIYYYYPRYEDSYFEYRIDSIFVTTDTVGINIVDTSGTAPDTSRRIYMILKCHSAEIKYGGTEWTNTGLMNFGIYRIDSENRKVHSVRTASNGLPSSPGPFVFRETTVFDYNVETGDAVPIEHYYKTYNTIATVETFFFGGYTMKKQLFSSSIGVLKRTQLAGILNTTAFAAGAIPNVIDSKPNAFLKKMVYHDGSGDSLVLERGDFRLY